jgi:hypothetical protein
VGDDQLVRVALLLRQGPAGLDALGRVGDHPVERRPPAAQPERGDHETRVTEHLLGLEQALALDASDERVALHRHVVEVEGGRVAEPDAVLVLGLGLREALGPALDDEPARPARAVGQDGVGVGDPAVADPLLAPVEAVAHHAPVLLHGGGGGLQRAEVAARLGLGRAVGEQEAFLGEPGEPQLPLVVGGADRDRVAAERGGEHARRHPEVDGRHLLADPAHVEAAAAHAAVLLGNEQQVDAQVVAAHLADQVDRALVIAIEPQHQLGGQVAVGEVLDRVEGHLQDVGI